MILLPLLIYWLRQPMQFASTARWSFGCGLALLMTVAGPAYPEEPPVEARAIASTQVETLRGKQREGTRVSGLVGQLQETSSRYVFRSEGGEVSLRVLENQSLERIAKAMKDDPGDVYWKVSGQLTEFFDENFLLIDRAERSTRARSAEAL